MTTAYQLIKSYYGDRVALRTGVPLMNHIDEGLKILDAICACQDTKDAYCIHPIIQSDEGFLDCLNFDYKDLNHKTIILAVEYRRVANSYLSNGDVEDFVGFSCDEVKQMLIADKVQNYKDFRAFHYGKHKRSQELWDYFHRWFYLLGIHYHEYEKILI